MVLIFCNGDKVPGPTGMILVFLQQCWGCVKEADRGMLRRGASRKVSMHSSFISLNTNKVGVEDILDFRPLSLIGGAYKLLE